MAARPLSVCLGFGAHGPLPGTDELLPVRRGGAGEATQYDIQLELVLLGRQRPSHELKAQKHEKRIDDIGLAVTSNVRKLAPLIRVPYLAAVHAELSRKPEQARDFMQRGRCTRLIQRQHIHEIEMTGVIAADV